VTGPGRSFQLRELAALVGGELQGDGDAPIRGVNGLSEAAPGELSFYANPRYRAQLCATRASAVLLSGDPGPGAPLPAGLSTVRVPNPHLAFARVSAVFHPARTFPPGQSPDASVHPEAQVAPTATVMAFAVVERGARVGARSVLFPGAYVGEGAVVGEDCVLHPSASLLHGCSLGDRVVLHACAVVGADGFGYAFDPEKPEHCKIPQAGTVRVEDDVDVGACSCIDRATLGETVIGRGTKIDNLVQIAHNVKVGPLSLICAQAGVAGSAELGTGVVLAGQVGVVGHLKVGDLAKIGAQSGVAQDVPDGAVLSGSPAFDHRQWLKASAAFEKLPELMKELRALRRRVEALEKEKAR
jgi:UDP-3-O-[3-hydroxymyristoyl] glucosamine N-acyltransferase